MRIRFLILYVMLSSFAVAQHNTTNDSIKTILATPDYDAASVSVDVACVGENEGISFQVQASFEGQLVASGQSAVGKPLELKMPNDFLRWTPDHPFLYDLKISLLRKNEIVDEAETQFAMRCFNAESDENGKVHFTINHFPVFLFGPSHHPEPCSADSVFSEFLRIKDLGYNMVRLQGDSVPQSWYRYCDRIGLVVWHDALDEVSVPLKSVPIVEISVPLDETDVEKASNAYLEHANRIYLMAFQGFAAAVFERFFDSETDCCGLMSHDGKTLKIDEKQIMRINRKISHAAAE